LFTAGTHIFLTIITNIIAFILLSKLCFLYTALNTIPLKLRIGTEQWRENEGRKIKPNQSRVTYSIVLSKENEEYM
jgi:hypothetical protein